MPRLILKVISAVLALVAALVIYNGLRHLVYWGHEETVSFDNGGITVGCTLVKPGEEGTYPAVLELLGSGQESTSGPGYRINASNMLRHGFAVMLCDKRGVGTTGGDYASATFAEFASDSAAAVRYLAGRDDIDAARIGILTNSESGWYAPQVAAESGAVAFIANRVGPPLSWMDTVSWEVRNEFIQAGAREEDLDTLIEATQRRWRYYISVGNNPELEFGAERDAINKELALLRQSIPNADALLPEKLGDHDATFYRSYAIDAAYDPAVYLRQLDIPLLYVFGGIDVNVPTEASITFLNAFRDEYAATIDVRVYPDLGHPMATWRGALHGGYPPDYLSFIGEWAVEASNRR